MPLPLPRLARRHIAAALLVAPLTFVQAQEAKPVVGDDNPAIAGRRVAVLHFAVEFYRSLTTMSTVGGGTSSMISADLGGVDDATLQAITDRAYADTLEALQRAGFEVLPDEQVQAAAKAYLEKQGKPSPWKIEDDFIMGGYTQVSSVFAPAGQLAFFSSAQARGNLALRTSSQNAGLQIQKNEIAKALDATLIEVNYLASHGTPSATRHSIFSSTARSSFAPGPVLFAQETQWQLVGREPRYFTTSRRIGHTGAVYLDQPLNGDAALFSLQETQAQANRSRDEAGNAVSGALAMFRALATGQDQKAAQSKTRTYAVQPTSADAYRAAYGKLISDTAQAFAARLAAARK